MYAVHVTHTVGEDPAVGEVSDQHLRPTSKHSSKPHPCDRCSKSFSSIHQLSQHTRVRYILVHLKYRKPAIDHCLRVRAFVSWTSFLWQVHTGEKPYKCNYCERRFKQQSHVKQHSRLHTGERPYKCTECGRTFVQVGTLVKRSFAFQICKICT